MSVKESPANHIESMRPTTRQIGSFSALLLAITTLITFILALIAIPNSGANCLENCFTYPYLDTLSQFPNDYLWMIPAQLLLLIYIVLFAVIHHSTLQIKRLFSQIALVFAAMSAVILLLAYFSQISIVPVSLLNGETEGITLITQYNPHGLFIAMEELGYLLMSFSFLFIAPAFSNRNRLELAIRWIFVIAFVLALLSLLVVLLIYGLDRQDRFEVIVISINWLVLIINGALLALHFRRQREI